MNMGKGWRDLASAVIIHAMRDRERALRTLRRNPRNEHANEMIAETNRFFRSEWFEVLLGMSGIGLEPEEMRDRIYEC